MIEVVAVDLGGVAAHFRPDRRLQGLATLTGLTEGDIDDRLFRSGLDGEAELGAYSLIGVIEAMEAAFGQSVPLAALVEAWALAFEPNLEILDAVAALPVRRVIFTNNGPMADVCLAGPLASLAVPFHDILCSWHLRARKPGALAFRRAAEHLGYPAERILLLDDSPTNVASAIAAGWNAACVTSSKEFLAALGNFVELLPSKEHPR